jgi:hypothetical protein
MYGMNRRVTYRTLFCIHANGLNVGQLELRAFYLMYIFLIAKRTYNKTFAISHVSLCFPTEPKLI